MDSWSQQAEAIQAWQSQVRSILQGQIIWPLVWETFMHVTRAVERIDGTSLERAEADAERWKKKSA